MNAKTAVRNRIMTISSWREETAARLRMQSAVRLLGLCKGRKHGFTVSGQLHRAASLDCTKLCERAWPALRNLAQSRIVKDHVGRHGRLGGDLAPCLAQRVEHRIGRSYVTPPRSPLPRRRNGNG